jgi:hypothetical protein
MNRTLNVVRMQLVNRQTYIWVPLIVLGGSFIITLSVYAILASSDLPGPFYGGGAQAPLWYFLAVGVQSLTLTLPFSQAMSVTRREFYLGTLLTAALTAAILAIVFVIGGLVEEATGGWGMNGYFFHIPGVWDAGAMGAGVFFFALAMMFFIIGFVSATIYKRFGSVALTAVLVGVGLLLVVALWFIGRADAWAQVFGWLAALGPVGVAAWGLVVGAVLAGISFLVLRRAAAA